MARKANGYLLHVRLFSLSYLRLGEAFMMDRQAHECNQRKLSKRRIEHECNMLGSDAQVKAGEAYGLAHEGGGYYYILEPSHCDGHICQTQRLKNVGLAVAAH